MIEIFDIENSSFLKNYENNFLAENYRTNNQFNKALSNFPQYLIEQNDYIADLISNYDNVFYPNWERVFHKSYVFKFEPDKPTMSPHIDLDPNTCKDLKGWAKRVIAYVNPIWDKSWGGGTYFAPFEKYKSTKHYTARVNRKVFADEATLVENVPGRSVLFDPDEWHMPQEFTGNTAPRLVYSYLIIHPEYKDKNFTAPDNDNGSPVLSLTKNSVANHIDNTVVNDIIRKIK
jgi:hypothetical protein